ncbi:hypothetical protein GLYMA_19G157900v4 [Glycine max]|nr:hypothetical protein GLYMA_19G157900v4 [Glycine max]KAH1078017.1 hypothetical protein GYH30_053194 [Glycine max]
MSTSSFEIILLISFHFTLLPIPFTLNDKSFMDNLWCPSSCFPSHVLQPPCCLFPQGRSSYSQSLPFFL